MDITPSAPIADITSFYKNYRGIKVSMLRLDQLHPVVSGNKWFKLKYNLQAAIDEGFEQIITFGGAYSNHLIATAAAARMRDIRTVGVIRGLHAKVHLTTTLQACIEEGMQLHFVSREDYNAKEEAWFLNSLTEQFGRSFFIPEGGDNDLGRLGAGTIAALIPADATTICLPVGTGTSLCGIRNSLPVDKAVIGFTAMKGGEYLHEKIAGYLHPDQNNNWHLQTAYCLKGFAKSSPELMDFMRSFYRETGIPLDMVYTGKMMFGLQDLIAKNAFSDGTHLLCIHTGGLQGNPAGLFAD